MRIHPDRPARVDMGLRRSVGTLGRGIRKKIKEFSRSSRSRFRELTASIPRHVRKKSQILHICLTFPDDFPKDYEVCKKRLQAFAKRLERARQVPHNLEAGDPG